MPEISSCLSQHSHDTFVKIWKINESADFFQKFPDSWSMQPIQEHVQAKKYLESLAARYCLWELMKSQELTAFDLMQDDRQKPFISHPDWHISISHSYPFAAACISKKSRTGIDLEKLGRNVEKIAPRFLNPTELAQWKGESLKLTMAWSAKESIYKAWGKPGLSLQKEIQLVINSNLIQGKVHQNDSFEVLFEIYDDFLITLVNH
jgi:phosphopantetheinyl transferase